MALQDVVEQSVAGLGYVLVDIERTSALLRVTIDWPWAPGAERFITVEDCEKLTRQLRFALEVEAIDFRRLEVSSPGIDRPLRTQADFERFAGEEIDVVLKRPIGEQAEGQVNALRKKFRGRLECGPALADEPARGALWRIVWIEEAAVAPGRKAGSKKGSQGRQGQESAPQALDFRLDELKEARLAPIVDFKGKQPKANPVAQ